MKVISKAELKLETFDKCSLVCDSDCPLGTLYDYTCSLKAFIIDRMKEQQEQEKKSADQSPKEEEIK